MLSSNRGLFSFGKLDFPAGFDIIAVPEKPQNSGICITAPAFGAKINHFPSVDLIC